AIVQPLQHDSWFGYVFWKRLIDLSPASAAFHAQNSVFAVRDTSALPPPLDYHTRTYSGTVMGAAANKIGHDWLVGRLKGPVQLRADGPPGAVAESATLACGARSELALESLERPEDGGPGRFVVGVRGPAGAVAIVALARARLAEPCGRATP